MAEPIRLALLGDPVEHSRSPAIHAAALAATGLVGEYRAVRADQATLEQTVEALRSGELDGLNITMPLKAAAAALADLLTPEARMSGSVNTLRASHGTVEAHSTDVIAFEELFADSRFPVDLPLLVIGSGSTARAALAAMRGRTTFVSARSTAKAELLAEEFGVNGTIVWGEGVEGSVVVNATPLGMGGETLPETFLTSAAGVIDLPYGDRPTPAVSIARDSGLPHADGVEFLARQARASFSWWTGRDVDLSALVEAARNV